MSLRYLCRVALQGGMRAAQAAKEHATRSIKDATAAAPASSSSSSSSFSSVSSRQVRRLSSAVDGGSPSARAAVELRGEDRRRRAEESLRTVMYLSCWGPN